MFLVVSILLCPADCWHTLRYLTVSSAAVAQMRPCCAGRLTGFAEAIGHDLQMTRMRAVLAACAVAACGCSSVPVGSVPRSGPGASRSFTADNWVIVAPGGVSGDSTTPARLDVLRGSARTVSRVPGPPGREWTVYPWAVSGQYVAAVTETHGWNSMPAGGVAYVFRPGGAYVRLGRAVAVYAASQPGRFWIRSASFGGHTPGARARHCTVTEMSATGQRIAGPLAAPCARWIIAAVPGGFLSVPTATANAVRFPPVRIWEFGLGGSQISPETPVQRWDPASGTVVRTYRIDPAWIYCASAQYLAWRPRSASGINAALEITNLSTGMTRRITLPRSAGHVTWRDPVLASQSPYLAWMEITKATFRKFSMEVPSAAGGAPALPGPGRVKVLDVATGRVVLDRAMTIAESGAFDWSLFVTVGYTSLNVVPTWSATAAIRNVQLPTGNDLPDTQQLIVTLRTGSH
jgi:hypothetical protein